MKIKIFNTKSCCGRTSILLKCDKSISKEMIDKFISMGFTSSEKFLKSGILYVSNNELSLTGALGSNNLQMGCKVQDCESIIQKMQEQLQDL